jgi:hypothetical protein
MPDDSLQALPGHRAKMVTFPPHAANIFQCLDRSLFGILKRQMNSNLPFGNDHSVAAWVKHIFHNFKQTLISNKVCSAFMHIGIQYSIKVEPYLLTFDECVLRESSGFLEIWQHDYPLGQLLLRRKRSRFGSLNQEKRIDENQ